MARSRAVYPGRPGRPSKLTEENTRIICAAIRTGAVIDDAAAVAGVTSALIYHWVRTGNRAREYQDRVDRGVRMTADERRRLSDYDRKCMAFTDAIREARAQFAVEHANVVVTAATQGAETEITITKQVLNKNGDVVELKERRVEKLPPSADAAMWLLERRQPQAWGRSQRIEISGPDGGEIPVPTDMLRDELLAKLTTMIAGPKAIGTAPVAGPIIDADVIDDDPDSEVEADVDEDVAAVRDLLEG
jgi:transposase